MGLFKDMRSLAKEAKEMTPPEQRGMRGGLSALRQSVAEGNQKIAELNQSQRNAEMLAESGIAGQATIGSIHDTGVTINMNPEVRFDVTVSVPGQEPYAASFVQVISRLQVGSCQPGAQVAVKVSPTDPQVLMIV